MLHRGAERAFLAGAPTVAALSDVTRLLLLLTWFFVCWKHARNVSHKAWTYAARAALLIALAGSAILY